MVANVFISYIRNEGDEIARALRERLSEEGHNTQSSGQSTSGTIPLNAQWVILVRTPKATNLMSSQQLNSEVDDALRKYLGGQLQGVLAVATSPTNPDEVENIPSKFSAISTYDLGTTLQERNHAFERVVKTLGYTTAKRNSGVINPQQSIQVQPSSTHSQSEGAVNRGFAGRASSSIGNLLKRPGYIAALAVVALLIIFVSSGVFIFNRLNSGPSTGTNNVTPTTTRAVPTSNQTATSLTAANSLYTTSTGGSPTIALAAINYDTRAPYWNTTKCIQATDKNGNISAYSIIYTSNAQFGIQPCLISTTKKTNKNFAFRVAMSIDAGGDAGGIIFQSDDSLKNFYRFSLNSNGNYKLIHCLMCQTPDLGDSLVDNFLASSPSGKVTLTAIIDNNVIYLYINNGFVAQVPNQSTDTNRIGLYAGSTSQTNTTVTFSDLKIWNLP